MAIIRSSNLLTATLLAASSLTALPAYAYIGPGTGLSAIGSLVALIAAILVAVFGFMWYPLKRMLRNRQGAQQVEAVASENPQEASLQAAEQEDAR